MQSVSAGRIPGEGRLDDAARIPAAGAGLRRTWCAARRRNALTITAWSKKPKGTARWMPSPGRSGKPARPRHRGAPIPTCTTTSARWRTAGLLVQVDRPIDKDTEMHPLVRWQFRGGIAERDRKAFLFTNVVDARAATTTSRAGRRSGGEPRDLSHRHRLPVRGDRRALGARDPGADPAAHRRRAPCHDIVIAGAALDRPGNGLDGLPLPISTPGFDIAPYTTLSQFITKRSRHRGAEHGQLPRPGEVAPPPRHEPVARAAARHLQPLGEAARARHQAATDGRCARRTALHHLCVGAENPGDARRASRRRRAGRFADQRGEGEDGRPPGSGREPRS